MIIIACLINRNWYHMLGGKSTGLRRSRISNLVSFSRRRRALLWPPPSPWWLEGRQMCLRVGPGHWFEKKRKTVFSRIFFKDTLARASSISLIFCSLSAFSRALKRALCWMLLGPAVWILKTALLTVVKSQIKMTWPNKLKHASLRACSSMVSAPGGTP